MKRTSTKQPVLPDLLQTGLSAVFCGTAPGHVSAAAGHYYAHPQNKFWRTLHTTGLTPRLLAPAEFRDLIKYGIGLTDIAKFTSGQDNQLPKHSLGPAAALTLKQRVQEYQPAILAFTSLEGGRRFLGRRAMCGAQEERIGASRIWILPSPSPKAHWNWDEAIWRVLAEEIRAAKRSLSPYGKHHCALKLGLAETRSGD